MNSENQTLRDFIQDNKEALVRTAYVVMTAGVGLSFDPSEDVREEGHDLMSAGIRIKQLLINTGMSHDECNALFEAVNPEDGLPPAESQA